MWSSSTQGGTHSATDRQRPHWRSRNPTKRLTGKVPELRALIQDDPEVHPAHASETDHPIQCNRHMYATRRRFAKGDQEIQELLVQMLQDATSGKETHTCSARTTQ